MRPTAVQFIASEHTRAQLVAFSAGIDRRHRGDEWISRSPGPAAEQGCDIGPPCREVVGALLDLWTISIMLSCIAFSTSSPLRLAAARRLQGEAPC